MLQKILPELDSMIQNLSRGHELEHFKAPLNYADFRGSDVRLLIQTLVEGAGSKSFIQLPLGNGNVCRVTSGKNPSNCS